MKLIIFFIIFSSTMLVAADWVSFRGNQAMNFASTAKFPDKPALLWSYDAPDAVESTATIIKDTAFIGCKDGTLLALNIITGKLKWKWKTDGGISSSPLYLNNRIYFGDENGIFHAVNLEGKEIWKYTTEDKIISSANTDGTNIFFGSYDNNLYCINQEGKKVWSLKTDAQVHCSPCIAENKVIIAGCDGNIRIIDSKTGKQKYAIKIDGNISASPAYYQGIVYIGTLNGDYLAANINTGKLMWKKRDKESGSIYSSAAVNEQLVIFADRNGKITVLSRKNGQMIFQYKMKKGIDSSPVIIGNSFYVGSDEGLIIAMKQSTAKKPKWIYNAGDMIKSSPAISGTKMIIGCNDGAIYCFGK